MKLYSYKDVEVLKKQSEITLIRLYYDLKIMTFFEYLLYSKLKLNSEKCYMYFTCTM